MKLEVKSTKGVIAPETSVYLEATLTPPKPPKTKKQKPRKPIAVVLVFDRSGSMGALVGGAITYGVNYLPGQIGGAQIAGGVPMRASNEPFTKIACVRAAAEHMVDMLSDKDYMGIVSFSTTARVEIPLQQITPQSRAALVEQIRKFQPGETTNIEDGLEKAFGLFSAVEGKDLVCKAILLSDGIANVGCSDPDGLASVTKKGCKGKIVVSALGVGEDYQAQIMTAIAQAGQGEFYHIREAKEIEAIVAAEVAEAQTVTAKKVSLEISVPATVAIGDNLNGYTQDVSPKGVKIALGDLARVKTVITEISMPAKLKAKTMGIDVMCEYEDVLSGGLKTVSEKVCLKVVDRKEFEAHEADKDLGKRVGEMISASAVLRASVAYEQGDMAGVAMAFNAATTQLTSGDYGLSDADRASTTCALDSLRAQMASHSVSSGDAKLYASRAYGTTRSRNRS